MPPQASEAARTMPWPTRSWIRALLLSIKVLLALNRLSITFLTKTMPLCINSTSTEWLSPRSTCNLITLTMASRKRKASPCSVTTPITTSSLLRYSTRARSWTNLAREKKIYASRLEMLCGNQIRITHTRDSRCIRSKLSVCKTQPRTYHEASVLRQLLQVAVSERIKSWNRFRRNSEGSRAITLATASLRLERTVWSLMKMESHLQRKYHLPVEGSRSSSRRRGTLISLCWSEMKGKIEILCLRYIMWEDRAWVHKCIPSNSYWLNSILKCSFHSKCIKMAPKTSKTRLK